MPHPDPFNDSEARQTRERDTVQLRKAMTDQNKPIDAEIVPEQTQALTVRQAGGAVGVLRPADTLDNIAEAFRQYQAVCEKILNRDDYQTYEGKPRKKKSAWRKLATAFNVSTVVVSKDVQRNEAGHVVSAQFTVKAFTGPQGNPWRQIEAEGYCEVHEKCCASARGEKCHKAAWKGHYCCQNGCSGRRHFSHPDHDIIGTAQTRATNRAIADLIGCGEVSAEELTDPEPTPAARQEAPRASRAAPAPSSPSPAPKSPNQATPTSPRVHIKWFLQELDDIRDQAREFFIKISDPSVLMPNESLEQIPAWALPTEEQFNLLRTAIMRFGDGEPAGWPYKPERGEEPAAAPAKSTPTRPAPPSAKPTPPAAVAQDPEWFMDVIVSMPRAGMKKDEYLKHPDTIRSLYEARHGQDEESQSMRQRLWGLVHHFEAKPWTKRNGEVVPPSQADKLCRSALDAFNDWFEKNHPDEKL